MRPLNDDLILFAVKRLRHVKNGDIVRVLDAGCSRQTDGSRSSRSHDRPFALETLRDVLARLLLQVVKTHRMERGLVHRGPNLWGHAGSGQNGVDAGGVDDRWDPELRVVVLPF